MFKLTIDTDNAAFAALDDKEAAAAEDETWRRDEEIARILARVRQQIRDKVTSAACIDANGNTCGRWEIS
jgi:hypothetical protein